MKEIINQKVFIELKEIIIHCKKKAKLAINSEIIIMNWYIGRLLSQKIFELHKIEYGKRQIEIISEKLTLEFGKGFDKSSLFRMVKFYNEFPIIEKVATLSQRLSWSHFVEILPIKEESKREFYIVMCMNENWDVRTLRERKNSMLFERTAISKRPDITIMDNLKELQENKKMSIDIFLKDPYMLNFLDLNDTYSEKDLENSILDELEQFILEMGTDFAFLARQKHFVLDGKDYYIDLLFYHRSLKRLVIIELKLGEFEPEYKGQVELYLKWLDKHEKNDGEESPLALILCAEKSDETIELLDLDKGNIRVGQYLTKLPPKEVLQEKLNLAVANAKKRLIK